MKRFAVILAVVSAVAICVGAPTARQAAADPSARGGDGMAGKFLEVNVRQPGEGWAAFLQNASIRRLGNREFLTGEVLLLPDTAAEWQGVVVMLPLDQIDSIYMFDDRDKLNKMVKDHKAKAATQAAVYYAPPPPASVSPPPVILPGASK